MKLQMRLIATGLLAITRAVPVAAQSALPVCDAPASLPPGFASWSTPAAISAGAATNAAPLLSPGVAVTAKLLPTAAVRYAVPPGKPGDAASFGGLLAFDVPVVGTYQMALGGAAWIDVLAGDKPVTSATHGHGPACTRIRKIVDFALQPGRHVLQIVGSAAPTMTVMVLKRP